MWILLDLIAFLGFLKSFYFMAVAMNVIPADSSLIPAICRMKRSECLSLLSYAQSNFLSLSNYVAGLIYYPLIFLLAFLVLLHSSQSVLAFAFGISLTTVFLGIYPSFELVARLKILCRLCFADHVLNLLVAVVIGSFLKW